MPRRKIVNRDIRKIQKKGTSSGGSYAVTLPVEYVSELGWRERQKVRVRKYGKKLIIEDWEE